MDDDFLGEYRLIYWLLAFSAVVAAVFHATSNHPLGAISHGLLALFLGVLLIRGRPARGSGAWFVLVGIAVVGFSALVASSVLER